MMEFFQQLPHLEPYGNPLIKGFKGVLESLAYESVLLVP
ncbi:Uncharacterised protein [Streptococcus pneumoniae]|nr:Uncharacterised protein [Streptococcus pneumoniae]